MALNGREDFLREQIEQKYNSLMSEYDAAALDERSQTHLQVPYFELHLCRGPIPS